MSNSSSTNDVLGLHQIPSEAKNLSTRAETFEPGEYLEESAHGPLSSEEPKLSDVLYGPLTATDKQTQKPGRSYQIPSPAAINDPYREMIFIFVCKGEGHKKQFKQISLDELPGYEAQGWTEWFHEGRPTNIPGDRDTRNIQRTEDVWEMDGPFKDTSHLFATGIKISTACDGLSWGPGEMVGKNPEARAPTSHSAKFLTPSESSRNFESATSRGHLPKFPRPLTVGAGWGGYDQFNEWQYHGRQVKKSMVQEGKWEKTIGSTLSFIDGDSLLPEIGKMTFNIGSLALELQKEAPVETPMTLYEQMNKDRSKHAGGAKRDTRGGRGSHQGRGGGGMDIGQGW